MREKNITERLIRDNVFINNVNRNTGKIDWIGSLGFRTDSNPIYFTRISFNIP